ncbi:MAG: FHA domain-containing protein [Candidatus Lernaella stagnicola]|nr:FHA domain-containing protein [Candidatus Lernaella stagnicola]
MSKDKTGGDTVVMDEHDLMVSLYTKQSGQQQHPFLECVEGEDVGKRFLIGEGRQVVGRSKQCHIRLNDKHVSSRHAEVRRGGVGLLIEDLESANGTFVNERRVKRAVLANNDEIRLGQSTLKVIV